MAKRDREGERKRESERAEPIGLSQSFDGSPEKSWWDMGRRPKGALSEMSEWREIRPSLWRKKHKTPLF